MTTTETKEKSNDLRFSTSKKIQYFGKASTIYVEIRLNDQCSNGHQDFSITGDIYENQTGNKNDRYHATGGCIHEHILKHFPQFKIFVDLHLCDYKGNPMYTDANRFYHIKQGFDRLEKGETQKSAFCKYYGITESQYNTLLSSEDKGVYKFHLYNLGIVNQWKAKADKAIKLMEEMTGKEFFVDSTRLQLEPLTEEERKLYSSRIETGFYNTENIKKREDKRLADLNKSMIEKVNADYKKAVRKHEREKNICLELINQGFEISPRTGNIIGAIYYNHTDELNFNWSTEKIEESAILAFIENLDPVKFEGLKISNDKQLLSTI